VELITFDSVTSNVVLPSGYTSMVHVVLTCTGGGVTMMIETDVTKVVES